MGGLFFCVSSVSFQALFFPPPRNLLIIISFQEDNIFGTIASLTYVQEGGTICPGSRPAGVTTRCPRIVTECLLTRSMLIKNV